jgi:hypothetical protein
MCFGIQIEAPRSQQSLEHVEGKLLDEWFQVDLLEALCPSCWRIEACRRASRGSP